MLSKLLKKYDPINTLFLILTPIFAVILTYYAITLEGIHTGIMWFTLIMCILTGISITGGYHRLISHKAYKANPIVKLFFLLFGAAAFQNSALKWSTDHRRHHTKCDGEEDPYNINKGFFHAHMGWIFLREQPQYANSYPKDLLNDKLVMWQHKYYLVIAITLAFILPTLIGFAMGAPLSGFAIGALCRLVMVHHTTFLINSLCHYLGRQPYTDTNSAKDSALMALFTYGEGYHNYHHYFQTDYRNGIRFYHFDPTKWLIFTLSKLGLAHELKRTPEKEIQKAKENMRLKKRIAKQRKAAFI